MIRTPRKISWKCCFCQAVPVAEQDDACPPCAEEIEQRKADLRASYRGQPERSRGSEKAPYVPKIAKIMPMPRVTIRDI